MASNALVKNSLTDLVWLYILIKWGQKFASFHRA